MDQLLAIGLPLPFERAGTGAGDVQRLRQGGEAVRLLRACSSAAFAACLATSGSQKSWRRESKAQAKDGQNNSQPHLIGAGIDQGGAV